MDEPKKPKSGEWWRSNSGLIAYIVGSTLDGDPVWMQKGSRQFMSDEMKYFLSCFDHEPRCTGFDWVPVSEADPFPHYYESKQPDTFAYIKRDSETRYTLFWLDGKPETVCEWVDSDNSRKRLTEAEALSRVKPADVWPKFVVKDTWKFVAYIRRDNATLGVVVNLDGTESAIVHHWDKDHESFIQSGTWRYVSESEALARVKPPVPELCQMCCQPAIPGTGGCLDCTQYAIDATKCPVESPDDWVEISDKNHIQNRFCDQIQTSKGEWVNVHESHGATLRESGRSKCRCRRKDLPNPEPTTKRVPVRLTPCFTSATEHAEKQ